MSGAAPARGLTLVEVLAATVLLAVVAGVAASLLAHARLSLERARGYRATELADLALFADRFLDDPGAFGRDGPLERGAEAIALAWPERPERPRVVVHRLDADPDVNEEEVAGAWLVFEFGTVTVSRWVRAEREHDRSSRERRAPQGPG